MRNDRDLNMSIVHQLGEVNRGTGEFVAGILYDSVSVADQMIFATRLADLALAIKERATGDAVQGSVIEGEVHDDCNTSGGDSADNPRA